MMKVILNKATNPSADKVDANFPASNLLTRYKSEVYKSTNATAKVSFSATPKNYDDANIDALYIGNTNAYQAIITVKVDAITVLTKTVVFGGLRYIDTPVIYAIDQHINENLILGPGGSVTLINGAGIFFTEKYNFDLQQFIDLIRLSKAYTVEIDFTTADSVLYVGAIRCGTRYVYESPNWGLEESVIDNSISRKMASGAYYYKERQKQRQFTGRLSIPRDDQYQFKHVFDKMAIEPVAVYLHGLSERSIVFATARTRTRSKTNNPINQDVNFTLNEQL